MVVETSSHNRIVDFGIGSHIGKCFDNDRMRYGSVFLRQVRLAILEIVDDDVDTC